jgi:hypothetical protein
MNTSTEITDRRTLSSISAKPSGRTVQVLGNLRRRRGGKKAEKVSAEEAASVIKDYILPLFEADWRQQSINKRSSEKGISRKLGQVGGNTLYGDIKLSDQLLEQIAVLKRQNSDLILHQDSLIQSKEASATELNRHKLQVSLLQTTLQTTQSQVDELQSQLQSASLASSNFPHEVKELTKLYNEAVGRHEELKEKYTAVLKELESVKYVNLTITHEKELLKTQVEMIASNLHALHKLMAEVKNHRQRMDRNAGEIEIIVKDFDRQKKWTDFLVQEYERIYLLRKAEQLSLSMLDGAYSDMREQREKALKYLTKRNAKLSRILEVVGKENTELRELNKEMSKKYEGVSAEFKKLWTKHSKVMSEARSHYEKCRRCDKMYVENDNFNWSCRTHTSTFGAFWLCCGKGERSAVGCSTSKHLPLSEIEKLGLEVEAKVFYKERCMDCKASGHTVKKCPKDPNRIVNLAERVERPVRAIGLAASSLSILKAKLGNAVMSKDSFSSSSNSSQASFDGKDSMDLSLRSKLKDTMKVSMVLKRLAEGQHCESSQVFTLGDHTESL